MNQSLSLLGRQFLAIWKQLGLNQRISIALTGAVVLAGLIGVGVWSSRRDFALLYGRLDEAEAARVIAALDETKVAYEARSGGSIWVASDQVHQVRMQLAGKGIPRGEGIGFEIFDKPNFGMSDFVQHANFKRALQGELARTISELDLVESARVMIVLPENRLLIGNQKKPTASVFIRVRGAGALPASAVSSIRLLVANAVEGLAASSVSVVDNQGNVLSDNQEDSLAGLSGNQLEARKNLEAYLARKTEGMLETVLGQGQAVVRVAADINWDSTTRFEERFDPDGQVIRTSMIDDEDVQSSVPGTGGAPGVTTNAGMETNNAAGAAGNNSSRTKKKTTNNEYEINRTVSNIMQSAGSIERLTAAVFIAQRFEGTGADRKAAPRTPEELQKLRRIVQSALGIVESDTERTDDVTLEEMPFNDQPILELTRQLEKDQRWQVWLGLGQKLLFPLLGVMALFMFWRAYKRSTAEDVMLGMPVDDSLLGGNGKPGNGRGPGRQGQPETPPIVTVEVLNQLIRENPANMTQAVRTWMNRGKPANG